MANIRKFISSAIIVILSFILAVALFFCISEARMYSRHYCDEEDFLYAIQDKDYPRLVDLMYYRQAAEQKEEDEFKEYYATAVYYEAASYYKAYRYTGNVSKAEEQKKRMNKVKNEMGEYMYLAEEMLVELGIEEQ